MKITYNDGNNSGKDRDESNNPILKALKKIFDSNSKDSNANTKIRDYWESDLELEKWVDPAFQDFIDNEIVRKTSPKQKAENVVRESNVE